MLWVDYTIMGVIALSALVSHERLGVDALG